MAENRLNIDFENTDEPVAGSAAWIARERQKAKNKMIFENNKQAIDKASEDFPAFGRLIELLNKKEVK